MNPLARLDRLINNERTGHLAYRDYSLEGIRVLLRHYGDPHRKIRTVHIAGTNGKGSTAHMLQSILSSAGLKTGLYTSPHLLRINERIRIGSRAIPGEVLRLYAEELLRHIGDKGLSPTWFDALTLFAFRYFSESRADIAVIETGLGGRLDSTNVLSPLLCVITDISYDHRKILGDTLREITAEKAGIIKPGIPVLTSNRNKSVLDILRARCREASSPLYVFQEDFSACRIKISPPKELAFDFRFGDFALDHIRLQQPCGFQAINASLAAATAFLLGTMGFPSGEGAIREGLARVNIPGRFLELSHEPLIIFDPAHNPAAIKAVVESVKKAHPGRSLSVVVSFMRDKEYLPMLNILRRGFGNGIHYYELNDPRALRLTEAAPALRKDHGDLKSFHDPDGLAHALGKPGRESLILFTGSFRLFRIAKAVAVKMRSGGK